MIYYGLLIVIPLKYSSWRTAAPAMPLCSCYATQEAHTQPNGLSSVFYFLGEMPQLCFLWHYKITAINQMSLLWWLNFDNYACAYKLLCLFASIGWVFPWVFPTAVLPHHLHWPGSLPHLGPHSAISKYFNENEGWGGFCSASHLVILYVVPVSYPSNRMGHLEIGSSFRV